MTKNNKSPESGFALVEAILILVIIGLISGIGVWIYGQNQKVKDTAAKSESANGIVAKKADSVKEVTTKEAGTVSAVETITKNDSVSESASEDKESTQESTNATNDLKSATNIGDSFNESTLF